MKNIYLLFIIYYLLFIAYNEFYLINLKKQKLINNK